MDGQAAARRSEARRARASADRSINCRAGADAIDGPGEEIKGAARDAGRIGGEGGAAGRGSTLGTLAPLCVWPLPPQS
jgi:hypothetical protein